MTNMQRDKRVEQAATSVMFKVPFFTPGVCKLPVLWDSTIETACTAGENIRWNPEWFDTLSDPVVVTVLVHETCHCLLGHVWRAPEGADWEEWNKACDHAVNLMLKEFGAEVKAKGLADPFPFPDPQDAYCADARFSGWAEERIYADLVSRKSPQPQPSPQPQQSGGKGAGGKGSPQPQPGSKPGKAPGQGQPQPGKQPPPKAGSMPTFGQIEKPKGNGAAAKKAKADWDNTLIQSAKVMGTVPAGIERLVDEKVHPAVPWWERLLSWARERAADDWDFMSPDPCYESTGFLMPSLNSERVGTFVFGTDTSGSINQSLLATFQDNKQRVLDEIRPKRLIDIYCDASIHAVDEYVPGDTIRRKCPGGGGTDFRPVFEHLSKLAEPPKALIYLTDLCGSFPDTDPGIPVLWVTWEKDGKAPFGEVIYAAPES